jgi:hypothetical protein
VQAPHTSLNPNAKIAITTRPTPLQDKAFKRVTLVYHRPIGWLSLKPFGSCTRLG